METVDHHQVTIDVPTYQEPYKPFVAVIVGTLVLGVSMPIGATIMGGLALGWLAYLVKGRSRRRLVLSHDTLTFESDHLGDRVSQKLPWDRVSCLAHPEDRILELGLDGERVRLPWHGPPSALLETATLIHVARGRFDPTLQVVEPEPEALQRLRNPQR